MKYCRRLKTSKKCDRFLNSRFFISSTAQWWTKHLRWKCKWNCPIFSTKKLFISEQSSAEFILNKLELFSPWKLISNLTPAHGRKPRQKSTRKLYKICTWKMVIIQNFAINYIILTRNNVYSCIRRNKRERRDITNYSYIFETFCLE